MTIDEFQDYDIDPYIRPDCNYRLSALEVMRLSLRCGNVLLDIVFPKMAELPEDQKIKIDNDSQSYLARGKKPYLLPSDFLKFLNKYGKYRDFDEHLRELGYQSGIEDNEFIRDFWELIEEATLYIQGLVTYTQYLNDDQRYREMDKKEVKWMNGGRAPNVEFNINPHLQERKKRGRPPKPDSEKKRRQPTGRPPGRPRKILGEDRYENDGITFHKGIVATPTSQQKDSLTIHNGTGRAFSILEDSPTPPLELFENIINHYRSQSRLHFNTLMVPPEEADRLSSFDIDISMLPEGIESIGADKISFNGIIYTRSNLGDILVTLISPYVKFPNFRTES